MKNLRALSMTVKGADAHREISVLMTDVSDPRGGTGGTKVVVDHERAWWGVPSDKAGITMLPVGECSIETPPDQVFVVFDAKETEQVDVALNRVKQAIKSYIRLTLPQT